MGAPFFFCVFGRRGVWSNARSLRHFGSDELRDQDGSVAYVIEG